MLTSSAPRAPPNRPTCPSHPLSLPMLQVVSEAKAVFGSSSPWAAAEPSRRAVDDMAWTLAVLKEALRKYSVVPVVTRNLVRGGGGGGGVGAGRGPAARGTYAHGPAGVVVVHPAVWDGSPADIAMGGTRQRLHVPTREHMCF